MGVLDDYSWEENRRDLLHFFELCDQFGIDRAEGTRLIQEHFPDTYHRHPDQLLLKIFLAPQIAAEEERNRQLAEEIENRRAQYVAQFRQNAATVRNEVIRYIEQAARDIATADGIFVAEVPAITVHRNPYKFISNIVFKLTTAKANLTVIADNGMEITKPQLVFAAAPIIFKNLGIAAHQQGSEDKYLKPAHSQMPAYELAKLCFKDTNIMKYLDEPTPLTIPHYLRAEHMYILGRTGHGKSTALFHIMHEDIMQGEASIILIEPKGDLVRSIAKLEPFSRSDRLEIIDPKYTPAFNFFALPERLKSYGATQRKQIIANTIAQYANALSTLGADTSINQQTTLAYVVDLVFNMGGTLWDFLRILEDRAKDFDKSEILPPLMKYVSDHDRGFFEEQFYSGMLPVSRKSLAMKIRFLMKSAPQFETMFGANDNKIDIYQRMKTPGSVTLINASEGTLTTDACKFFGRLILSQIMTAALERQATGDITHPVYVFVDEAHLFIDETVEKFLLQTRSAKVGITLANQQLKDLGKAHDTVLTQPAIKIAAASAEDAPAMARNMRGSDPELFNGLNTGQFAIYYRPMPAPQIITIPNTLRTAARMSDEDYAELINQNYHRFLDSPRQPPQPQIRERPPEREKKGTEPRSPKAGVVDLGEAD